MRSRLLYLKYVCSLTLTATFLLAAASACSGRSEKKQKGSVAEAVESPVNTKVQELDDTPDEAFLAKLDLFDKDSLYVTPFRKSETLAIAYQEALSGNRLHGTLRKGNTYSILLTGKHSKTIAVAVNTTELSGRWIYNQKQHRGFDINEGGGMSSINTDNICFREWKLLNGLMYIYFVDVQQVASDRHQYQVEEAHIAKLNSRELNLEFHGQTFRCKRPSKEPLHL